MMNQAMRIALQKAGINSLSSRVQPDYSPLPYQVGSHDGETYEDHDPDHVLVRAELLGWETELVCWIWYGAYRQAQGNLCQVHDSVHETQGGHEETCMAFT